MKRHINNPYKVNWKMYCLIGGIATLVMIIAVCWNHSTSSAISDVIKNLAFGCEASILVALFIEIGSVKDRNEKANRIYDAVFHELRFWIMKYVETWSDVCCVAFKGKDYYQEKHTWMEWYEIVKNEFEACDENRKNELIKFFKEELLYNVHGVEKTITRIKEQQYILNINDVYNEKLNCIIEEYSFEFYATKLTLKREYKKEDFWGTFDAVKQDLVKDIYNWVDIRYYNYCRFKPYKFFEDEIEIRRAIDESEKE